MAQKTNKHCSKNIEQTGRVRRRGCQKGTAIEWENNDPRLEWGRAMRPFQLRFARKEKLRNHLRQQRSGSEQTGRGNLHGSALHSILLDNFG